MGEVGGADAYVLTKAVQCGVVEVVANVVWVGECWSESTVKLFRDMVKRASVGLKKGGGGAHEDAAGFFIEVIGCWEQELNVWGPRVG